MADALLLAVCGRKGHGKDTVGALLAAELGLRSDSFAAPIKAAARDWFGLSEEQVNGTIEQKETLDPRWDRTPREIMQLLGTEVGRAIHADVWARAAVERHRAQERWWAGTVITDCRFPNEARIVREAGGVLVYVVRPGVGENAFSAHASEREIEAIGATADHRIDNDGDLDDLDAAVCRLVEQLHAGRSSCSR